MYTVKTEFSLDKNLYKSLIKIFKAFLTAGKELFLVGGCCRDLLLGRKPKDYDLTTNATPEEVKEICKKLSLKTFDSGIKHGTLTIIDKHYNQSYEITTYRTESVYSDHRHPDKVEFVNSLEEDLKRRDFTINSFAYNLFTKELVMLDESYLKDLEFGIIRTVGDPAERYEEDALRMLRALRFSAQLNFSIEKYTYKAIEMCSPLMSNISKERIRDELTKIIMSDCPEALVLVSVSGLEKYLFDDSIPFTDMLNCDHQNPWHYTDVFHHTMDVLRKVPKKFELRWAALFHDIGKPVVKQPKVPSEGNHYVYYGHPEASADIADMLMEKLKFSNAQKELIHKYVLYHDADLADCRRSMFKRIMNDIGKENFPDFIQLKYADAFAHKLQKETYYAIDAIDKIYRRYSEVVAKEEALTIKDLAVNGYDAMEAGFEGKEIGEFLKFCLNLVLEDPSLNKKEILLRFVDTFKDGN